MIKLPRAATAGFAIASILSASNVFAHHSTAAFNMNNNVVLSGTSRRFDWRNPHTWIVLEVPNSHGGIDHYGID
jgi:Family of unknown function (DUF6152)